jgi:hypothetical protein
MSTRRLSRGLGLLAAGAIAGSLFLYTTHKIHGMRMVRGEIEGARFVDGTVSRKWQDAGNYGPVFWIHLTYSVEGHQNSHETNLDEKDWNTLAPGHRVRLAILPDGTVEVSHGIWASPGNMVLDRILQGVELLAAVLLVGAGIVSLVAAARRPDGV